VNLKALCWQKVFTKVYMLFIINFEILYVKLMCSGKKRNKTRKIVPGGVGQRLTRKTCGTNTGVRKSPSSH
jgi:hypothetical protein